jgi:twitching motility two-component system response regulator PilG
MGWEDKGIRVCRLPTSGSYPSIRGAASKERGYFDSFMKPENTNNSIRLSGFMNGIAIDSFVQLIESEEKTCTAKVASTDRCGYLYFDKGLLVDAQLREMRGEQAALEILGWQNVQIEVLYSAKPMQKTIRRSLKQLLLESVRMKDEVTCSGSENDLEAAIRFAGQLNAGEALRLLSQHLKANPKSWLGWLWYSRLSGHIGKIRAALETAHKIAPENPQIIEEIRKLKTIQNHLTEGRVKHCPFCWCALALETMECGYCGSVFAFSFERLKRNYQKIKIAVIEDAIARFAELSEAKESADLFYFSAIAHFNLNRIDTTLDLLKKAAEVAPDKGRFSGQLNTLLKHIASKTGSEAADAQRPEKQVPEADPGLSRMKAKILVVEDSPTTRKVIVMILRQANYHVSEAKDGLEAMSKLNEEKPDLLLLDVILPKVDGYKILSLVKDATEFKNLPVVMLTSKDGIINRVKGKLAGCSAYLTKPFKPEELLRTVERYLPSNQ